MVAEWIFLIVACKSALYMFNDFLIYLGRCFLLAHNTCNHFIVWLCLVGILIVSMCVCDRCMTSCGTKWLYLKLRFGLFGYCIPIRVRELSSPYQGREVRYRPTDCFEHLGHSFVFLQVLQNLLLCISSLW